MGLSAGVDMQLNDFPHEVWQNSIAELVASGEMDEAVLDEACRRVLRVKFLLGLFENPTPTSTAPKPCCAAPNTWRWPNRSRANPSCC